MIIVGNRNNNDCYLTYSRRRQLTIVVIQIVSIIVEYGQFYHIENSELIGYGAPTNHLLSCDLRDFEKIKELFI